MEDYYNINIRNENFESRVNYGNIKSNIEFIEKTGLLDEEKEILEVGSGLGNMIKTLAKKGYKVKGIDIDKNKIEEAKSIHGNIPIKKASGEEIPFENEKFDIVMSFDVFEHIQSSDKHLREVRRVLKDGGHYLLQTPNKYTNIIFEVIRQRSMTRWKKYHCSLHSYKEVVDRFENNDFEVKFHDVPVVNDFFKSKLRRYMGRIGVALLNIYNPDDLPMRMKTNFFVEARKVSNK
jgi:2-polyprenyl-3-methyl-5-hydroxy-6-metoxy-1,4-benzoquinol methylase